MSSLFDGSGGCSHEWRILTHTRNSFNSHTIIYFEFDGVSHVSVKINGERSHSHNLCGCCVSIELWTLNTAHQDWTGAFSKIWTDSCFFIDLFCGIHQKEPSNCFLPFLPTLCVWECADGKSLPIDVDTNEADSNQSSIRKKNPEAIDRRDVALSAWINQWTFHFVYIY